jgi:micrococcal nuclease
VKALLAAAGAHKAATAVVVAVAIIAGGGVVQAATNNTTTAKVVKVVDGDTIDVKYDGEKHRVRLLNINTPESVDPDKPVECLGPEASEWLKKRLPAGTEVRLERDQEKLDRYDRELAAVFVGEDLINAEIARAGLGVPMSVGENTKFLSRVEAAQAEAESAHRGLYATVLDCTLPAQVAQLQAAATQTIGQAPAATAAISEFDSHAAEIFAVLATAKALLHTLDGDIGGFPLIAYDGQVSSLRSQVTSVQSRLDTAKTTNRTARAARQEQLDTEARLAAEEAARKAAEEAARQAEEAAAAAAAQAAQRSSSKSTGSSSRSSGSSSATRTQAPPPPPSDSGSGGGSGYTGCRSYAPGGKTWTPIPC